jgi:hypothetical protein
MIGLLPLLFGFGNGKLIGNRKKVSELSKDYGLTIPQSDKNYIGKPYSSDPDNWEGEYYEVSPKNFNRVRRKKNGEITTKNVILGHLRDDFRQIRDHPIFKYVNSIWNEAKDQTENKTDNRAIMETLLGKNFEWPTDRYDANQIFGDLEGHTAEKYKKLLGTIYREGYNKKFPILAFQDNIWANGAHRIAVVDFLKEKGLLDMSKPISMVRFKEYPGMRPPDGLENYLNELESAYRENAANSNNFETKGNDGL